jgi:hypothetical protein
MIYEESSDKLEEWLNKVLDSKIEKNDKFIINQDDVE